MIVYSICRRGVIHRSAVVESWGGLRCIVLIRSRQAWLPLGAAAVAAADRSSIGTVPDGRQSEDPPPSSFFRSASPTWSLRRPALLREVSDHRPGTAGLTCDGRRMSIAWPSTPSLQCKACAGRCVASGLASPGWPTMGWATGSEPRRPSRPLTSAPSAGAFASMPRRVRVRRATAQICCGNVHQHAPAHGANS
jgi:hypothetical protein